MDKSYLYFEYFGGIRCLSLVVLSGVRVLG